VAVNYVAAYRCELFLHNRKQIDPAFASQLNYDQHIEKHTIKAGGDFSDEYFIKWQFQEGLIR
jgi:hypothetical protein